MTPPPSVRDAGQQVTKLIDVSICTGCKACQAACDEWNDLRTKVGHNYGVYDNPMDLEPETWTVIRFDEYVDENGRLEWLMRKDGCMHCEDPGCLKSCPAPGAIVQFENGIVDFESEHCIGCGYCMIGCPFNIPRVSHKDNRSYKCTLCSDRVAVGQEPACVKTCTTGALAFGERGDMLDLAEVRVQGLKERGFANAGIYNPQGVGGTHVVYVLPHADKPEIYTGLPKDPSISPVVLGWKDWLKPLGAAAFIGTIAGVFSHFAFVGPCGGDQMGELDHKDDSEIPGLKDDLKDVVSAVKDEAKTVKDAVKSGNAKELLRDDLKKAETVVHEKLDKTVEEKAIREADAAADKNR
ncbi:formate dehydrogenase subunit beta [Lasius niger]|uniref:Formate dehydrogenase subunit beta n=1 Tax=Lasius niger TaxID=67767 RepID=A0A0J7KUD8_LASNI|nr:formate dehydrogenase subunit beta [Lasius niger]